MTILFWCHPEEWQAMEPSSVGPPGVTTQPQKVDTLPMATAHLHRHSKMSSFSSQPFFLSCSRSFCHFLRVGAIRDAEVSESWEREVHRQQVYTFARQETGKDASTQAVGILTLNQLGNLLQQLMTDAEKSCKNTGKYIDPDSQRLARDVLQVTDFIQK